MKKILPVTLSLLVTCLVGCATTNNMNGGPNGPTEKVTTPGLSSIPINSSMDANDRTKLQQLVANARKTQNTAWQSSSNNSKFEFTSLKIYVNDEGQPCRDYKIVAHLDGFLYHAQKQVTATACRKEDAEWHLIASKELDN